MFLLATPLAAQSATGPNERGSMILAGSANVSRSESDGNESTSISVQPNILYFVANRLAIGGQLGFGSANHENGETSSWTVGPAARLYFGASTSKTLPYLGIAFLIGSASSSTDDPIPVESEASVWGVEGIAGLTFMISRQVGIAGELFFNRNENEFETPANTERTIKMTSYGLRFGITAFVF
jgi:hypothetical protein